MCCCLQVIVKVILFTINTIVSIQGLILIGLGSVLAYFKNSFDIYVSDLLESGAIVLIVIGCVIFFIAFSGCCGAAADWSWLLIVYAVFMAVLCGFKIYLGVVIFQNKSSIENTVMDQLNIQFEKPEMRESFYMIEYVIGCCGSSGGDSYESINVNIPPTCCPNFEIPSGNDISSVDDIIQIINGTDSNACPVEDTRQGCGPLLLSYFLYVFDIGGYLFVALAVMEGVAVIFAMFLIMRIRRNNDKKAKDKRFVAQRNATIYNYYN